MCFVDIYGIVDHHLLSILFITNTKFDHSVVLLGECIESTI
jgi:hypothetical protein